MEGGAFVRFRALWCRQRKTACHYFGSSEVPLEPFAWQAARGQSSGAPAAGLCGLVIECWSNNTCW